MIKEELEKRLSVLNPQLLSLENESQQHAGYYSGKETHFKLIIVSEYFNELKRVRRHQEVYNHIKELLKTHGGKIHAFSIHAYTPIEWQKISTQEKLTSPPCLGRNPDIH